MNRNPRLGTLAAFLGSALLLGACSSLDATSTSGGMIDPSAVTVPQAEASPREDVPSALRDVNADGLPAPLVDPEELRSGGPPPDGIPPIDEPRFLDAAEVDFLADEEPVLAVEIDGHARAYPVQILIWHEIVNDTVGDVPVIVTYCPLCNTAVAADRRIDGRTLTFGTSGLLYQSSLVMWDRQTESLWSHVTGQALAGHLTGTELVTYPVATVSWRDWREAHPEGLVLSRDTGVDRDYGRNPYPGYDDIDDPPFLFDGEIDGRLSVKERLVGTGRDTDPTAILLEPLLEEGVITFELDGEPTLAWALPGTASALETARVDDGRDVGATGVFRTEVDGRQLDFERRDGAFVDQQTGSRWNVFGRATGGPLEGTQLEALMHVDTFWFAWAAFAPDTTILPTP
jgi:hypothetical protein